MRELRNPRIRLRDFGPQSSINNMLRILSNPNVSRPYGLSYDGNLMTLKAEIEMIAEHEVIFEAIVKGKVVGFVTFREADEDDIETLYNRNVFGRLGSISRSISQKTASISYALDTNYIGHGLGTKMVEQAIDRFFERYDCSCVIGTYLIFDDIGENWRSKNVLEKLGFKPFAIYRRSQTFAGENVRATDTYVLNPMYKAFIERKEQEIEDIENNEKM